MVRARARVCLARQRPPALTIWRGIGNDGKDLRWLEVVEESDVTVGMRKDAIFVFESQRKEDLVQIRDA